MGKGIRKMRWCMQRGVASSASFDRKAANDGYTTLKQVINQRLYVRYQTQWHSMLSSCFFSVWVLGTL